MFDGRFCGNFLSKKTLNFAKASLQSVLLNPTTLPLYNVKESGPSGFPGQEKCTGL